jgi:hypothetical protein
VAALLAAISLPVPADAKWGDFIIGCEKEREPNTASGMMTESQAQALQRMWREINALVTQAHREGREIGSNILLKLASGEATVKEFDEVTLGKGR